MRVFVQRVSHASVRVDGKICGKIDHGMLVLLGVRRGDTNAEADWICGKLAKLRIFADEAGKFNRSLTDVGGGILLVSQFTLYAETARSGNRPSFSAAAQPERANELYEYVRDRLRAMDLPVECGVFGASMQVELCNDGPVSLMIEREVETTT